MTGKILELVRNTSPLVHCMTNYVTVNDCANALIAVGASPIMSDDESEVSEITAICSGLVLNIGTLNQRTISSMVKAGLEAKKLGHPILLDPVGAGASALRTDTATELIDKVKPTVIRGNISEIKTLAIGMGTVRGVDANESDLISPGTLDETIAFARRFAEETGAVIVITGVIDIAVNAEKTAIVSNGTPMLSKITGSGCMLSAIMGAFISAGYESTHDAVTAALCSMGLCGELAKQRLDTLGAGNSTYRNLLIDELYNLDGETLSKGARYEIR